MSCSRNAKQKDTEHKVALKVKWKRGKEIQKIYSRAYLQRSREIIQKRNEDTATFFCVYECTLYPSSHLDFSVQRLVIEVTVVTVRSFHHHARGAKVSGDF